MKKLNVLTRMLLLVALLVGSIGSAWGAEVTYTVSTKTEVNVSGTAPVGSTATFVSNGNSAEQLTGKNGVTSQTLTLTNYNGYRISKITLNMKSNTSSGAGKLRYSVDGGESWTYLVGSSDAGVNFNNEAWYGSWSTDFVNVIKNVNITCTSNNLIFKIEATANSLYCHSYTLTYETVVPTHTFNYSATNGSITVTNGGTPVASGSQVAEGATLNVEATPNTGYSFSTWTKDAGTFANALAATTTFTMPTTDATIGATFTLNSHSLDVSGDNGTFNTTVNGVAWNGSAIPYGSTVSITAVPNSNYAFKTWDASLDSYSATDNPLVFTMPDDDVIVSADFVSADFEYNVTINPSITNGSVVADNDKAKAGVTVTLTANPNSGYAHTAWSVTDGSSNEITVTNNQFVMPASDVTVNATFTKVHTITYQIGDNIAETTRLDGEELSIPVSASGFAGWTDDDSDVTPSISNDDVVTDDMELYAVFVSGYDTPTYNKVTSTAGVTAGQYLIVYETDKIVFDGSLETLDKGGNTKSVSSAYTAGIITASDAIDAMNFTLAVYDGGFSIQSASGKYIGKDNTGNGMDTGDSQLKNTITIDGSGNAAIVGTGGPTLRFNSASGANNYRFRYYGSGQQAIQLYKRTENPTYTLTEYEAVNISAAGWATYATKSDVEFTDGDAYVVVSADDVNSTTTIKSVTQVPAGTPVLMKGTSGSAVVKYAEVLSSTPAAPASNYLHIVGSGETINEASGVYVLANKSEGVGFYPWTGTALAEGKVYLQLPAGAKLGGFFGICEEEKNETDGISNVSTHSIKQGEFYNLAGQRVSNPTRGLYIINGKKVIIK